ncbi:hypothetical protein [Psychrobacillus phage Perkons]|nr:hypothetical protein [Psychrobacillus phage Perkons]
MKLIFLDIDGVMNSGFSKRSDKHFSLAFDDNAVTNLKQILERTGAMIVVSSTWRLGEAIKSLKEDIFIHYGLDKYIVGVTPYYQETIRGLEIADYLAHQHNQVIESFVILDDDTDMGSFTDRLVKTNAIYGLTVTDSMNAIRLLNE